MADYEGNTLEDLDKTKPYDTDSVYTAAPALRQIKAFLTDPEGLQALLTSIINLNKYDVGQYYLTNDEEVTEESLSEKFSGTWQFIPNGINSLVNYSEIGKSSMELIHRKTYTVTCDIYNYSEKSSVDNGWEYHKITRNTPTIDVSYTVEIYANKTFTISFFFNQGNLDIAEYTSRRIAIRVPMTDFTIGTWDTFVASAAHPQESDGDYGINEMGGYIASLNTPNDTAVITNVAYRRASYNHTEDRFNAFCKGVMSVLPSELEIEDAETIPESATNKIFVFVRTA